jgi:hypothetical protein
MNPSDSRPSQTAVMFSRSLWDSFPHESLRPVGSLRFLIDLSLPAVLFHPGEPSRRTCSLLGDRWQASPYPEGWPFPTCVTRPKQVHLRYG